MFIIEYVINRILYDLNYILALQEVHSPSTFDSDYKLSAHIVSLILQLRFVCMSDTHCLTSHLQFEIPHGDVFVHAGDFTRCGRASEVEEFNSWIGKQIINK